MDAGVRIIAGGMLSAGVAAVAHRRTALTGSGAWAAAVAGTILVTGGWNWLALVGVFFVSSSVLTRLEPRNASPRRSLDRAGRRWEQVAANGGIATIAAAIYAATGWGQAFAVGAGAMAAATADTWATEIGRWSATPPRLITTGKPVAPGRSGGVTILGTLASAGGATLIALSAIAFGGLERSAGGAHTAAAIWAAAAWIAVAGFSGALVDSLLGATVESRLRRLDNDTVNLAMTAWAAAVMLVAAGLWSH